MLALQVLTALLLACGTVLLLAFLRSIDLAGEAPPPARPVPVPRRVVRKPAPAGSGSDSLRPAA